MDSRSESLVVRLLQQRLLEGSALGALSQHPLSSSRHRCALDFKENLVFKSNMGLIIHFYRGGKGYDTKVMRKVIALRKRDKDDIAEEEAVLEMYKEALGMA
jgi:hypothetical protein